VKPLSIVSEGTVKNKMEMCENDSSEEVIYIGNIQGPEKVKDTCVKTVHANTMDRGFTVLKITSLHYAM
jgi:hypothetical protein